MYNSFANIDKSIINELQKYQELDIQLQRVTGLDIKTLIDIARVYPLLIDDKNRTSIYNIAEMMRKTGLSFQELQCYIKPQHDLSEQLQKLLPWYLRLWNKIKQIIKIKLLRK